jgi:uracil phosphoribosyltransferase
VAVLRAGLGLLDGALRVLPEAPIGHLGLVRDEATLRPSEYVVRLPPSRIHSARAAYRDRAGSAF